MWSDLPTALSGCLSQRHGRSHRSLLKRGLSFEAIRRCCMVLLAQLSRLQAVQLFGLWPIWDMQTQAATTQPATTQRPWDRYSWQTQWGGRVSKASPGGVSVLGGRSLTHASRRPVRHWADPAATCLGPATDPSPITRGEGGVASKDRSCPPLPPPPSGPLVLLRGPARQPATALEVVVGPFLAPLPRRRSLFPGSR